MIGDDDFTFMADSFPGLVSQLQESAVKQAEDAHLADREKRRALAEANNQGLNISELSMAALESHRAKQQLEADIDKINQEAADAAAKKEADAKQLPQDRFPAPPITV